MKSTLKLAAAISIAALVAPSASHAGVASGGWPVSTGVSSMETVFTRNGCSLPGVNHMDGSVLRFKTRPSTNQAIQINVTATAWLALADEGRWAMVDDACKFLESGRTKLPATLLKNTRYLILTSWPAADVRWTITCSACSPSNLEY